MIPFSIGAHMEHVIIFKLKSKFKGNTWYIYAPKGYEIAGPFQGHKHKAIEWANAFISSWACSTLEVDESDT